MRLREVFALNLRKHRQLRGLSQEELAHRADIDRTYISALERSVYAASIDVIERLASVLKVEATELPCALCYTRNFFHLSLSFVRRCSVYRYVDLIFSLNHSSESTRASNGAFLQTSKHFGLRIS